VRESDARSATKRLQLRYSLGDFCFFRVSYSACLERALFEPKGAILETAQMLPVINAETDVSGLLGARIVRRLPLLRFTRQGLLYCLNQAINYYIDLNCSFPDYLSGFSSKTRSTLKRKVRKLFDVEGANTQFVTFCGPASTGEFHRLAREVAVKTYQEKLFDGAIPATEEFAAKLKTLAETDSFRGFILSIKGAPAAYLYLPAEGDILIYGHLGYDPAYGDWSPGTVLLYLALERLFAEGKFRYFDFTHGESQTKRLFGRESFLRADVYLFRWRARNIATVLLHAAVDKASTLLGRCLDALRIRSTVRRLIRRAASS